MTVSQKSVSGPVNDVKEKQDLYQQVTDTIISQMAKGVALWHKPWAGDDFNVFQIPKNCKSGKGYNGINILLLWSATIQKDHKSNEWASFKQWSEQGESIKKGEKGTLVVYYDTFEKEEDGELKKVPFLKASVVFNKSQLKSFSPETIEIKTQANKVQQVEAASQFVSKTAARIIHEGHSAKYNRREDAIYMPPQEAFFDAEGLTATEAYHATLFHELGHWTGHEHRLNREFGKRFGDNSYAFEELVAELTAAFLCAELSITNQPRETHASYLANWLDVMQSDKRAIFTAATSASKAVEYLKKLQTITI
ncbi:MAG: DUF1738 domain-containing protein [Bacteroidetes bacterium]|nr:DUF1738 domain-containing protein [Bacteroidota bacterium]